MYKEGGLDLFRALFADCSRVVIEHEFSDGFSGSYVYDVTPVQQKDGIEYQELHRVVKLQSGAMTISETQKIAENRIIPDTPELKRDSHLLSTGHFGSLCQSRVAAIDRGEQSLSAYITDIKTKLEDVTYVTGETLTLLRNVGESSSTKHRYRLLGGYDKQMPVNLLVKPTPVSDDALVHQLPVATTVADFYQRLHWAVLDNTQGEIPGLDPALQKPFATLKKIRQKAWEFLFKPADHKEYYLGLALHLIGAMCYGNLNSVPEAPMPKRVLFWGAAAAIVFADHDLEEWRPENPYRLHSRETCLCCKRRCTNCGTSNATRCLICSKRISTFATIRKAGKDKLTAVAAPPRTQQHQAVISPCLRINSTARSHGKQLTKSHFK